VQFAAKLTKHLLNVICITDARTTGQYPQSQLRIVVGENIMANLSNGSFMTLVGSGLTVWALTLVVMLPY
jgi:hypothetical protein